LFLIEFIFFSEKKQFQLVVIFAAAENVHCNFKNPE